MSSISGADSSADYSMMFLTALCERSLNISGIAQKLLPIDQISKFEIDDQGNYALTLKHEVSGSLKHSERVANGATVTFARVITGRMSPNKLTFDQGQVSASKWFFSSSLREVESTGELGTGQILTRFVGRPINVDYSTSYEDAITGIGVDIKK